jgi:hypothetical protein
VTKPPRVVVAEFDTVTKTDSNVQVLVFAPPTLGADDQTPGHSEVDDHEARGFEPEQSVLADPIDRLERAPDQPAKRQAPLAV